MLSRPVKKCRRLLEMLGTHPTSEVDVVTRKGVGRFWCHGFLWEKKGQKRGILDLRWERWEWEGGNRFFRGKRGVEEFEKNKEMMEKKNSKKKKETVCNHWEMKRRQWHLIAKRHIVWAMLMPRGGQPPIMVMHVHLKLSSKLRCCVKVRVKGVPLVCDFELIRF